MKFFPFLAAVAITLAPLPAFAKPGVCMVKAESSSIHRFSCDVDVQQTTPDRHQVVITTWDNQRIKLVFNLNGTVAVTGDNDDLNGTFPFILTKDGLPVIKFDHIYFHFYVSQSFEERGL